MLMFSQVHRLIPVTFLTSVSGLFLNLPSNGSSGDQNNCLLFIHIKLRGMFYHLNLIQQMLYGPGLNYIGYQLICKTSNMFWETSVA